MKSLKSGYGPGILLIAGTFLVSALICLPTVSNQPTGELRGSSLLEGRSVGPFSLTRETGDIVRSGDLSDSVWLAAFTFTRCPSSCPRISATLKGLQENLSGSGVRIVSFSVDPNHDTPAVLKSYGARFGADPSRWSFLTGDEAAIYDLIGKSFYVSATPSTPEQRKAGAEEIAHSDRIVLVDRGLKLVRHFDSNDPADLDRLITEARRRDLAGWIRALPKVNASLNFTSFVFLIVGWILVRRGRWRSHAFLMLTCLAISAAFLGCYLTYHYFVGTVRFAGSGPIRSLYLTILLSHTVLAVVMVPLIGMTVYRAIRKDFDSHRKIARITFPIWVYISLTGVVIYLMLYQMNLGPVPVVAG